jgi:DMSO reductase anchor subunit/ferredoxin
VLAYDKDETTGIVRHLDDQCIGCSYCILKCPYDVPKYNDARGIVRKCDMCQQRLAVGEAPACVQACPTSAIAIRIVKVEAVRTQDVKTGARLLPSTVESSYTLPTTRYISSKPVPATSDAADAERPRLEDSHTPLAVMLVLTQLATGALLFAQNAPMRWMGFAAATVGIFASVSHLGQPLKAWRCFLGWRRSWLSREILTFAAFAPMALIEALRGSYDLPILRSFPSWSAAAVGMLSVLCSVMVYVDTRRPWWSMKWTGPKFLGTVVAGGLGLAACYDASFTFAAAITAAVKLAWETLYLSSDDPRDKRSQRLLLGQMRYLHGARFLVGMAGCVLTMTLPVQGFCVFVLGEFLERKIFFRAAAAWKMPGNA